MNARKNIPKCAAIYKYLIKEFKPLEGKSEMALLIKIQMEIPQLSKFLIRQSLMAF